jgi:hypothetical protein
MNIIEDRLELHAIICHKGSQFKTREQALRWAKEHFKNEHIKTFVRETGQSFRVRVRPKTKFDSASYVSKQLSPEITLVWGKLKI